jgi:sterol desaturase/sphingolipid hydroxylase (fatty acid hydroxylase superfamily)
MIAGRLFGNVARLLVAMALIAMLESFAPLHAETPWRRNHLAGNLGLSGLTLLLNLALGVAGALGSEALRARGIGLLSGGAVPAALDVVIAIVVLDLATYALHVLMHRVPWMWRVHRVHHSDPLVDVTTAYRQHPIEVLLRFAGILLPAWALGLSPQSLAAYRVISGANALLEHANFEVWQPIDDLAALLVVTPNMHKVHHSRRSQETDSNYGNILSIFDRLFRTFTPAARHAPVHYGLAGYDDARQHRLPNLLQLPYLSAFESAPFGRAALRAKSRSEPPARSMHGARATGRPPRATARSCAGRRS